jgi:DNA-binding IclR family transcriptional regulator
LKAQGVGCAPVIRIAGIQSGDFLVAKVQKYRAPALDKGLEILELLSRATSALSMTEIATNLGYSNGEIFRMLQVLEERNYISRPLNDSGYILTNRLFMLAMERPQNRNLVEAALPIMYRLAEEISHPCHLVVASQEQMVVVARVDSPSDLGFIVRIGHRRPIAHSTSGLVLFAFQSPEVQARWLALLDKLDAGYKREHLLKRAKAVAQAGFASFPSDAIGGVVDLSAPICEQGHAIGALAIPFIDRHPSKVSQKVAIEHLLKAAKDISVNWQESSMAYKRIAPTRANQTSPADTGVPF